MCLTLTTEVLYAQFVLDSALITVWESWNIELDWDKNWLYWAVSWLILASWYSCEPWVPDWVISVGQIPEKTDWAVSGLILAMVFVWALSSWLSFIWIDKDLKAVLEVRHLLHPQKINDVSC